MKKLLYILLGTAFGLVLIVITAVGILLGTETGLNWALRQADRFAPNLIAIDSVEGHLLDHLHLHKVRMNLPTMHVQVEDLVLDWYPRKLVQREFHLGLLKLDAVVIDTSGFTEQEPEAAPQGAVYPIELPDLQLPIAVIIDAVQVNGIEMRSDPDVEPTRVDSVALQARWDDKGIVVQQLDAAMQGIKFEADGSVNPVQDYPLQIHTLLALAQESLPKGKLQGTIQGDKNQLDVTQRFTGDAQVTLTAVATQPLENLAWEGNLKVLKIPGALISPELPAQLKGQIETRGDLKAAQLNGQLFTNSDTDPMYDLESEFALAADFTQSSILIHKLRANHQTQPMQVSLSGSASVEDSSFDLHGGWQDLRWPLSGEAMASSDRGDFSAMGSIQNYQFNLATDVSGKDLPRGRWTVDGVGNQESLSHIEVLGQTLEGVIKVIGEASWVPQISADITTTVEHINPGVQYSDWPGSIEMDTSLSAKMTDLGPVIDIALNTLTGELRGLPIRGDGVIKVSPERVNVDSFVIGSGDSEIRAHGHLGEQSELKWGIDIPKASDLIPEASGRLSVQGLVQGPMAQPLVSAQLAVESLSAAQMAVERLAANLDVDLSFQKESNITLSGRELNVGSQRISQLSVDAHGTLDSHQMQTNVSHDLGQVQLDLQGGLKDELWMGKLQNLSLQSSEFGNWDLQRPTELTAGATAASATPICLQRESAHLCVQGQWKKLDEQDQRSSGSFEISAFPLSWLKPWLPEDIQKLDGDVSAQGKVDLGESLLADVNVDVTPGQIVILRADIGEVTLPHQGVKLVANAKQNTAKGDIRLGLADNNIAASFQSPNVLAVADPLQAKIEANVKVDGPNLDFVSAMVPQISQLQGSVLMDFDVHGAAAHPKLAGKGDIDITKLEVPEFGVALKDSSIDIYAKDDTLEIEGLLASAEGNIKLKGNSLLDAQSGWPTQLKIQGDHFLAVNLPEASVYVSPDLYIEKTEQALRLTGRTTVPKADIFLKTLPPSARSAHSDVVVVQETEDIEETPQSMPVEMDVTLTLGEEIHFIGFGLDAYFDGELKASAQPDEAFSVAGDVRIDQGTFRAYGQDLSIEQGIISFAGGPPTNPGINLRATRQIDEITAGVNAIGPIKKPRITNFSVPAMGENDIISYLLTGRPARELGEGGDSVAVTQQINSNLSAKVGTNLETGEAEFSTRYRLSRKTHVEATTTPKSSAADIYYTWELE